MVSEETIFIKEPYSGGSASGLCEDVRRAVYEHAVEYAQRYGRLNGRWRFEFIPEPLPERVKWPWPDVRRVLVGVRVPGHSSRPVEFMSSAGWELMGDYEWSLFGTWPANESRIASNDNGFVKLSEVANGE